MHVSIQAMKRIRFGLQIVAILGGIMGIWLFYPPLSDSFYMYLTNHGFQDHHFQEYLQGIPNIIVNLLLLYFLMKVIIEHFSGYWWMSSVKKNIWGFYRQVGALGFVIGLLYGCMIFHGSDTGIFQRWLWLWLVPILLCSILSVILSYMQRREVEKQRIEEEKKRKCFIGKAVTHPDKNRTDPLSKQE